MREEAGWPGRINVQVKGGRLYQLLFLGRQFCQAMYRRCGSPWVIRVFLLLRRSLLRPNGSDVRNVYGTAGPLGSWASKNVILTFVSRAEWPWLDERLAPWAENFIRSPCVRGRKAIERVSRL